MRKIRIDYSFIINPIGFWTHALVPHFADVQNSEFRKKLRSNNKGFSLVELIIVIAIMAILAAAIAPALIRYINKARKADDIAFADSFGTSFMALFNDNDDVYDFVTKRVQLEMKQGGNRKYVIIGFTGYGNNRDFYTMRPGEISNELYKSASSEFNKVLGELIGMKTSKIPLKFYLQNELDQWIIAADKDCNFYVFVRGHLNNGGSWYITTENKVHQAQKGRELYTYMLWPEVDPKYNALNLPKDVVE